MALFSFIFLASISGVAQGMENSPLRLVFFEAPPFSWEKDGQVQGLAIDLLNEVLNKQMNLKVEYEIFPWERAQRMVKDGTRDGLLNVPTAARKAYTVVSKESLLTFNFIVFANQRSSNWLKLQRVKTIEDLAPFTNCHIIGTHWGKKLTLAGVKTHLVQSPRQAFLMLNTNRCDTFVAPSLIGRWAVKELGLQQALSGIPEVVMDYLPYHLMVSKRSRFRYALPEFDRIVRKLKIKGTIEAIQKKYESELLSN